LGEWFFFLSLKTRLVPEKIAFDIFLWQELLAHSSIYLGVAATRIVPALEIEETERMDGCCDGNNGEKRLTDQNNNNSNIAYQYQ
jgi:hypothetical protein